MYATVRLKWIGLLVWGFTAFASAAAEETAASCARSCDNCLEDVPFEDADLNATFTERRCSSRLRSISTYLCLKTHCPAADRDHALDLLNATCQETLGVSVPPYSIISNYSSEDIRNLQHIKFNETFASHTTLKQPVVPEEQFYTGWFDTLVRKCLTCCLDYFY